VALQGVGEIVAGELAALVGIENLRPAVLGERFLAQASPFGLTRLRSYDLR
jgi:hypothetical protein